MAGSLRQRSRDAWELRVYLGVEHDSGRERWPERMFEEELTGQIMTVEVSVPHAGNP